MMNMLGKAIAIAAAAHAEQQDKGGKPYILHCLTVMNAVGTNDEDLACAAVMHDVVEDTDWTIELLKKEGFNDHILETVDILTHKENVDYDTYIKLISCYHDAKKIKLADIRHNSDILRMKGLRKKDFDRLEKYHRAYTYLKD